jgi:hypothetical protein
VILARTFLSVRSISANDSGKLGFPFVAVGQELFFVIQQFLSGFSSIFSIGCWFILLVHGKQMSISSKNIKLTFHNGIDWAALLAVSAVDAFGHINVISGCAAASVFTFFGLNCDGLGRTDGFAQLAGNAAFFAGGVSTQSVFATETGGDWALFEGVEDGVARRD